MANIEEEEINYDELDQTENESQYSEEFDELGMFDSIVEIIDEYSLIEPYLESVSVDDVISRYPNAYRKQNTYDDTIMELSEKILNVVKKYTKKFLHKEDTIFYQKLTANKIYRNIQLRISRNYI